MKFRLHDIILVLITHSYGDELNFRYNNNCQKYLYHQTFIMATFNTCVLV